jgi:hypothetical protein
VTPVTLFTVPSAYVNVGKGVFMVEVTTMTKPSNAPVQDEQSKTPEKGELRDEELEKTSGGLLHPGPYPLNPQPLPP